MEPPRLFGLSDLHVGHAANRASVAEIPAHPGDWLIVAGDVGESEEHLAWTLDTLGPRYQRLVWVPGNHELWTTTSSPLRGVAKYDRLVELCRARGVLTPEDPYPVFPGTDLVLAPLFLLYDYSFCPDGMTPAQAIHWAAESGIVCADEHRLHPDPYPSREAWCRARVEATRRRLDALPPGSRTILVNHWPLRSDLCRLFRIPRFTPWCGTRETEDWHVRYRAALVVSGHLHMRATDWRDGVRFEEISLGYPRQYDDQKGAPGYLRQVWPATSPAPPSGTAGPSWHR
ncbi:MAG: metallophosphoesterase [Myxococcota bacterium]